MKDSPGRSRWPTPPWQRLAALLVAGAVAWCAAGAYAAGPAAEPPELVILPTLAVQVKPEGRNALLTCRAVGAGAGLVTGLRWRAPNDQEVPQPSTASLSKPPVYAERFSSDGSLSLIFQSLRRDDEGTYTCEGQYARGHDLARTVEIRVIKAISWVDAPQEQFPLSGRPYKVKCQVEAEPPPTVDWQKDGAQLGERYRVETDGVYIESAAPEDDGVYTCRAIVVATGELAMRPIKVEVQVAPEFAEESRDAELRAEQDGTVECSALGRPPPQFAWVDARGRDLAQAGGRFQVNSLTGALHVSPVRAEDEGAYRCVARNRAGERAQVVRVRVLVPPRVALVRNATAAHGAPAQLECEARGRPPPNVAWRRHGADRPLSPGVQLEDQRVSTSSRPAGPEHPDRADGVLAWDNVRRADDGLYACVATNTAGQAEAFAHLTVEFAPSFANTPYAEFWSWDNQIANITCLAESIPNATIHWYFNERDIEKNREPSFKKFGEGPQSWLAIDPSNQARYGKYRCVAKNRIGEEKHEIILHRAEKPGPVNQAVFGVVTATTIKFKIMGPSNDGGIPARTYIVRYREAGDGIEWRTHSWTAEADYTLEGLQPSTRYEFQFSARNDVGEGPWSSTISTVMPRRSPPEPPPLLDRPPLSAHPDKPMDDPVISPYPTHFELRWQIPADNGEPILNYMVTWCRARETNEGHWEQDKKGGNCQEKTLLANEHTTSFRLQPLQPGTNYMVHLHATNVIGTSAPSALLLRTAPGAARGGGGGGEAAAGESAGGAALSSAALVAAVVSALLAALLLLDLGCCACRRAGVIAALCERARGKQAPEDAAAAAAGLRIGASHGKEPLREETRPLAPAYTPSVKRDTSVGFDGKTASVTRGTFMGKDSAV